MTSVRASSEPIFEVIHHPLANGCERVVTGLTEATATIVEELRPFVPDLAARAAARLTGGSGSAPYARLAPVRLS